MSVLWSFSELKIEKNITGDFEFLELVRNCLVVNCVEEALEKGQLPGLAQPGLVVINDWWMLKFLG